MVYVEDPDFLHNETPTNAPRLILLASSFKSTHQVPWTVEEQGKNITRGDNGKAKILYEEISDFEPTGETQRHSCYNLWLGRVSKWEREES